MAADPGPKAIAIETSGRAGSAAVAVGGVVVAEASFPHELKHAAGLVPLLDDLVRGQGWSPADLDEIYVSAGPGSFTGVRIGVTVAKTLAWATAAKVVAVPTLRVLVANAPADARHVVIALDAKRDQVFTATFERAGNDWRERELPRLDRLAAVLARTPRPVHLLGEGIPYHRQHVPADVLVVAEPHWRARAGVVAEVGHRMARAGQFADVDRLTPTYVRRPEAEEKYDAAHGG